MRLGSPVAGDNASAITEVLHDDSPSSAAYSEAMSNIASGNMLAEIAALMGDPARANMLIALMGGQALTAGEAGAAWWRQRPDRQWPSGQNGGGPSAVGRKTRPSPLLPFGGTRCRCDHGDADVACRRWATAPASGRP
ncbi:hypothetical protein [Agrobacterium vitis]|uniref:hypothetical protein n=1 Tax=Agrobacterium vitis TaxID=373 RepID=UPI003D2C1ACA